MQGAICNAVFQKSRSFWASSTDFKTVLFRFYVCWVALILRKSVLIGTLFLSSHLVTRCQGVNLSRMINNSRSTIINVMLLNISRIGND